MSKTSQREVSYFDLGKKHAQRGETRTTNPQWRFREFYLAGVAAHKEQKEKGDE